MPAKMNEIKAVACKFGIPIIEDAAEGLGSTYFNEPQEHCQILVSFHLMEIR